jgi:ABC-type multidrug transport system permease subunit
MIFVLMNIRGKPVLLAQYNLFTLSLEKKILLTPGVFFFLVIFFIVSYEYCSIPNQKMYILFTL